jgi:Flp pilus assembly protein TadG
MHAIARFSPWLSRLLRSRRGSAAIEGAFVFPVLVLLSVGALELLLAAFAGVLLEGAVREAARYGLTGYTYEGVTREDMIRNVVARWTLGLIDMNEVTITTLVYQNFGNIGQPEPFSDANGNGQWDAGETFSDVNGNGQWDADMGASGVGGAGDVVLYTVHYDWRFLSGVLPTMAHLGTSISLQASVAIRNEPF